METQLFRRWIRSNQGSNWLFGHCLTASNKRPVQQMRQNSRSTWCPLSLAFWLARLPMVHIYPVLFCSLSGFASSTLLLSFNAVLPNDFPSAVSELNLVLSEQLGMSRGELNLSQCFESFPHALIKGWVTYEKSEVWRPRAPLKEVKYYIFYFSCIQPPHNVEREREKKGFLRVSEAHYIKSVRATLSLQLKPSLSYTYSCVVKFEGKLTGKVNHITSRHGQDKMESKWRCP